MRHPTILVLVAAVLTCAIAQAGDVYKYVDERGQTMYTDKPIPGATRVSTGTQRPPEVAARSYATQQSSQNSQLANSNQRIATQQSDSRIAATVAIWAISWPRAVRTNPARPCRARIQSRSSTIRVTTAVR